MIEQDKLNEIAKEFGVSGKCTLHDVSGDSVPMDSGAFGIIIEQDGLRVAYATRGALSVQGVRDLLCYVGAVQRSKARAA